MAERAWWQRRCPARLIGPPILGAPEWRCDRRDRHGGECHFEPDDWPELAEYGGWRGLRDGALRLSATDLRVALGGEQHG